MWLEALENSALKIQIWSFLELAVRSKRQRLGWRIERAAGHTRDRLFPPKDKGAEKRQEKSDFPQQKSGRGGGMDGTELRVQLFLLDRKHGREKTLLK